MEALPAAEPYAEAPLATQSHTRRRARWNTFLKNPLTLAGLALTLLIVLIALLGGVVAPYPVFAPSYSELLAPPTTAHPFGTDQLGRDVLSRVLVATRLSLGIALLVLALGAGIGTVLGLLAGYLGGLVDELLMRLTDVFLAFPALILAIALTAGIGPGLTTTIVSLGLVWWPWYARLVRGQVLSIRELAYVDAARALGVPLPAMLWRHILPETLTPLVVQVSLDVGYALLAASSLSFLGLGAQPPTPEWGAMISDAESYIRDAWWTGTFPGLAIFITALGFNLLGDALQEMLDPRMRE